MSQPRRDTTSGRTYLDLQAKARSEQRPTTSFRANVHAAYSRDEILAAFGILRPGQRPSVREGVKYDEATNTAVLRDGAQDRGPLLADHDVPRLPDLA